MRYPSAYGRTACFCCWMDVFWCFCMEFWHLSTKKSSKRYVALCIVCGANVTKRSCKGKWINFVFDRHRLLNYISYISYCVPYERINDIESTKEKRNPISTNWIWSCTRRRKRKKQREKTNEQQIVQRTNMVVESKNMMHKNRVLLCVCVYVFSELHLVNFCTNQTNAWCARNWTNRHLLKVKRSKYESDAQVK